MQFNLVRATLYFFKTFHSQITLGTFVTFSIFGYFFVLFQRSPSSCWSTVWITVWHLLTSYSEAKDVGSTYWSFRLLYDSISFCIVKQRLLYVVAASVYFIVASSSSNVFFSFLFLFLRDSIMISINAVEFRYHVVILILVNLGKL